MQGVPSVRSNVPLLRVSSAEVFQVYAYELLQRPIFYRLTRHSILANDDSICCITRSTFYFTLPIVNKEQQEQQQLPSK